MDEKDSNTFIIILIFLAGYFTCETITIDDGQKSYEFQCEGVLEKKFP